MASCAGIAIQMDDKFSFKAERLRRVESRLRDVPTKDEVAAAMCRRFGHQWVLRGYTDGIRSVVLDGERHTIYNGARSQWECSCCGAVQITTGHDAPNGQ